MFALLIAGLAVTVEGDTRCPTAGRVTEVLTTLLVTATERSEPHRARLYERIDGVEVELQSGNGRPLGRRTFPRRSSCEELASAIAVVIATWEAAFAGDTPTIDVAERAPVAPPPPIATTLRIGGGVLAALDGSGWAGGGSGEVTVGRSGSRWSARVAISATTRKRDELAPGVVAWARHALSVGGRFQLLSSPVAIDVGADFAFGLLVASGEGFTADRTSSSFEPGLVGGVRLTYHRGAVDVYLETCDTWWWRDGKLEVTGIAGVVDLPEHELRAIVGVGWSLNKP